MVSPTLTKVLLALVPRVVMAAMHTTTIRASITAYSTAVGPSSAFKNDTIFFATVNMGLSRNVGEPLGNPDGMSSSPDRTQLVFFERRGTDSDLWLLDVRRGLVSRLTEEPDEDIFPIWAGDGKRIIYSAVHNGQVSLYERDLASSGRKPLIQGSTVELFATDTSPDGRYIVYQHNNPKTGWDVLALPPEPGAAPVPIVQTDADERTGRLSSDGRWLAFVSNNSGVSEIYVQPFPGPGARVRVSTRGGDQPEWRPDGSELFYIALDGKLMAVPIKPAADRSSIDVGEAAFRC